MDCVCLLNFFWLYLSLQEIGNSISTLKVAFRVFDSSNVVFEIIAKQWSEAHFKVTPCLHERRSQLVSKIFDNYLRPFVDDLTSVKHPAVSWAISGPYPLFIIVVVRVDLTLRLMYRCVCTFTYAYIFKYP